MGDGATASAAALETLTDTTWPTPHGAANIQELDMSTASPRISVIIPHLNQPEFLDACLATLEAQTLARDAFEILVVDNGSRQLPEAVIARHPGVRLLQEKEPGPGKARNTGVKAALGNVFAFIDADCRAHPRWLEAAEAALQSHPDKTILGGDVQIWREDAGRFTALEAYETIFAYRFKLYIEKHSFSGTGNLVVRREDFEAVGPFAGINVAEDMEWGRRARAAGRQLRYAPEMIVYHPARVTFRELFVKWDRHIQHAVNSSGGGWKWKLGWIARAFAVLASAVIDTPKVLFDSRLAGLSTRLKGLGALLTVRAYRFWRMLAVMNSAGAVAWNRDGKAVSEAAAGTRGLKTDFD